MRPGGYRCDICGEKIMSGNSVLGNFACDKCRAEVYEFIFTMKERYQKKDEQE